MFIETAVWIREQLGRLDLPEGARVADVGSSTLHYRTVEQPHIEREVLAPLRDRGCTIVHSDVKADVGVDVVFDVSDPAADPRAAIGSDLDLVISVGMLPALPDPARGIDVLRELTAPGGWLLTECPGVFRRVLDPEDNFWRPSPQELADAFAADTGFSVAAAESIEIADRLHYRGLVSRPSWTPLAGRWWLPLPGFTEAIRLRVPRWRWRDSVVLMRRDRSRAGG